MPGVAHRQAAVAQARDHGPARPPLRQRAVAARPGAPGRRRWERRRRRVAPSAGGRRARRRCGHRLRRAVVVHHLRCLRRGVPRRHRARRPHHGPAPVQGADGVVVPAGGGRDAAQRRELRRPVGPGPVQADGLGRGTRGAGRRRQDRRRRRVPVLGGVRGSAGGPLEEGHPHRGGALPGRRRPLRGAGNRRVVHR